ncbi:MAG: ribonuclease E/G [Candidatus Puniceispirillaceae bacterium]
MIKAHTTEVQLVYDEGRAALIEDGKVADYVPLAGLKAGDYRIGAILKARITQVFAKQNRAQCQLPDGQIASFRLAGKSNGQSGKLVSGAYCWITLSAMPRQHKPWQAEFGISRAGHMIVLHYGTRGVRLSHKAKGVVDDGVINALSSVLPEGWGAVIKRAGIGASAAYICEEALYLLQDITTPLPDHEHKMAVAYDGDMPYGLLRYGVPEGGIQRQETDADFWAELEDEALDCCERVINLASGAVITIEHTQALIAIDVDSGTAKLSPFALAKQVMPEIMRVIRLASYSGVIVIDLPRLGIAHKQEIVDEVRECAIKDSRHPDILGFSRAGLLEVVVRHRLSLLKDRVIS